MYVCVYVCFSDEDFHALFEEYDDSGDGLIQFDEVCMYVCMYVCFSDEDFEVLFEEYDDSGDGLIQFDGV